jgi:redox-sensing transcriptional repressor
MEATAIPEPTLRRLPLYHTHVKGLVDRGVTAVSCNSIGRFLGLDPSQIRKDFEIIGIVGKPRVGHDLASLVRSLESFLGCQILKPTVLAGADPLGQALLCLDGFKQFNLRPCGIFDTDEKRIGDEVQGLEIMPLGFLQDFVRMRKVQVGVITLPGWHAQHAADFMIKGGVRAIWNFAPVVLRVPADVIVENQNLCYSLAALSAKLARVTQPGLRPEAKPTRLGVES